jgi:hypothetical protein
MEASMRIIMEVTFPMEEFNQAVRDGSCDRKTSRILDEIKPEAVYFTERCGKRSAIIVADLDNANKIPALAEPWFLTFNAEVRFRVAMTAEDLKAAGLGELGKKWG